MDLSQNTSYGTTDNVDVDITDGKTVCHTGTRVDTIGSYTNPAYETLERDGYCIENQHPTTKRKQARPLTQHNDKGSKNATASVNTEGNNSRKLEENSGKATSCYDNAPDGGWGWVITFCGFMVGFILDGIAFSFGILFKELLIYFGESKSLTSWVISVFNGTYLGLGPVTSVLASIFGYRQVAMFGAALASVSLFLCSWSPNVQVLILLYGLIGGAGLGFLYLPALVMVGQYFKRRRALATGIAVCGSGVGGFVFAPLTELLIELYTWKGAMWIIAGICLNGIPMAALLRPLKGCEKPLIKTWRKSINTRRRGLSTKMGKDYLNFSETDKDDEYVVITERQKSRLDIRSMFDFELLKSLTFVVYGCSCFLCMLGFYIPFTYIPDLADDLGMTPREGAMLISIIGIANTAARVLVGLVADRSWANSVYINSVALIVGGAATMFVTTYGTFWIMAVYCVVFGIAIAVFVSLRSIIMAELLGIEKLSSSFGLVTMCQGLSAFIGAPIAGALSDMTQDYEGAFYMAGAAIALSGTLCLPLHCINHWENRRAGVRLSSNRITTILVEKENI